MIKNNKQLSITEEKIKQFEQSIAALEAKKESMSSIMFEFQIRALKGQLKGLQHEVNEYQHIKAGNLFISDNTRLENIGELLIKARIAQQMSQNDLATKLGIAQQQIQRYESSSYETASLETLVNTAGALGIALKFERTIFFQSFDLPEEVDATSISTWNKKLRQEKTFCSL